MPSPPPDHHVHFPKPIVSEDSNEEQPSRKIPSPPPPPVTSVSPKILPKTSFDEYEEKGEEDIKGRAVAFEIPFSNEETNIVTSDITNPTGVGNTKAVFFADEPPPEASSTTPQRITFEDSDSIGSSLRSGDTNLKGTPKFTSKELRGNLTRDQKNRDPLFFYEIVAVLGIGSMGSVSKVRKRQETIGGSARKAVQDRARLEKQIQTCFSIPVIGGMFRYCIKGNLFEGAPGAADKSIISTPASSLNASSSGSSNKDIFYAMKSIHLSRITDKTFVEELRNEIQILKTLDHPHIVRAIETFEFRNQIFVIMELCSGGDLYSRDPYTEAEAARITCSILSAIAYMHSKGILHRDLKYENILFVNESPQAEIKLIDFGLSRAFGNEELTDGVGTIYTMAPEVIKGSYTKQADLWSVGVIAYMLMSSQMPFYGRKRSHIVEQIMQGKYEFKGRRWKRISQQGKAFIDDLLVVDPTERATAEEALRASWLNRRYAATVRTPHVDEMDRTKDSLVRFVDYSKLRKVALMVVAHKSTSAEIGILRKVFQEYDTTQDGKLNYEEFKAAITKAGYTEDEHRKIFDAVVRIGNRKPGEFCLLFFLSFL
jgi:serine/threonine protein kinase